MEAENIESSEKVLVVDDDKTAQLKMAMAVEALGYGVETVGGGKAALELLRKDSFDLVLLDIVMPEMDGFEVLKSMKSDPGLRDIPVIVISALDSEMDSVVKAIELGAEDFLPKSFERVLLKARVNTCIEKKRRRDLEIQYLNHVGNLTDAAAVLETGKFNPAYLGLETVISRQDALGKLARVFSDMAQQIYERERRLNQQVRTLKGVLLLFAVGAIFGLGVPLTRLASELEAHPFGLTLWVNIFAFCIGLSIAFYRGSVPRIDRPAIRFFLVWGVISAVGEVFLFWVAQHLQASTISIILVTEGFIVFAFAAMMRMEHPKAKRLVGLGAGFVGIIIMIISSESFIGVGSWVWILLALIVPASYAMEDIIIAAKMPEDWDITAAVGLASLAASLMLLPISIVLDDFIPLSFRMGKLEVVVILLAIITIIGTVLMVRLITTAGAVFGSQSGYVLTFSGIAWSMLLLNETLPLIAWIALGIMMIGSILVEPKEEAEEKPNIELQEKHKAARATTNTLE
ncbi:MAG: response regulator [Gammaproteobacteria bacterium]|nr:response regulator [Gammaproteobacteria bacterium]